MKKLFSILVLLALFSCGDDDKGTGDTPAQPGIARTKSIGYSIIQTFPHDTSSYTQGLMIYKGDLYEGTGNYGRSHLMKVDLKTGRAVKKIALEPQFFGEGITILNDTVYQLTWQEKKVFVYLLPDFKKIKEFDLRTQGWGITHNGAELIVSDGSSNLYFYNPADFRLLRTLSVTEQGSLSNNLNELEYIDGYVYANQYQAPYIFKIDPASGTIEGKINLSDVWNRVKQLDPHVDVPNGIAHDPATGKTYITGKLWPELYEIQLSK